MSAPDAASDPADLDPRVERCRRVVDTLLDVGMKLVRTLDPERGPAPVRDPILAYCRIARALRLTLLVEARLAALALGGAPALAVERRLAGAEEETREDEPADGTEAGDPAEGVERGERDRIDRDRETPDEIDRLLHRPIPEIAAIICHDLGLAPAQAIEVQAAFADLTANDDTEEGPASPPVAVAGAGERSRPRGGSGWRGSRSRPPDLPR